MEAIRIAWVRDGQAIETYEVPVGDAAAARDLFDRLFSTLKAWQAGEGGEGKR